MSDFVDEHDLGEVLVSPVDVHLSDTDTFQPDIVFLTSEQRTALTTPQEITGGPALVVEVLSPSTGYYDLTKKKTAYARHGVRAYWIVDPGEDTVEVLRRDDDGGGFTRAAFVRATGTVRSRVLDGFTVDVAALFDR
jgi:Uma2 family endonuclease